MGSQGLRDGPQAEFSVEEPIANSSVFVFPSRRSPCSLQRAATVESYTGTYPARIFEPAVVSTPSVPITSLSAILEAVGKVSELDLEGVPPTSHPLDLVNVLAEDEPVPSLTREQALANAPDPEGGFFGVPPV